MHYSVFRLGKIFIACVIPGMLLSLLSENFIADLYWQTGLLVKSFTARETLHILAFIGYGKVLLSRGEEYVGRKNED